MPTAANLNLYGDGNRGQHGTAMTNLCLESGDAKLIVSVSFGSSESSDGGVSLVRMMKAICAGLTMGTFLSWMANARTSSFIVRALVWIRNGYVPLD